MDRRNTPVIVGAFQYTQPKDTDTPESPLGLMIRACQGAIEDSGAEQLLSRCDTIRVVGVISYPYVNACGDLAHALNVDPARSIYSGIGGNTPQMFVNHAAADIAEGRSRITLITGGEAAAAMRRAKKAKKKLDWTGGGAPQQIDTSNRDGFSGHEAMYDFLAPAFAYAMIENTLRHDAKRDIETHRRVMGRICERLSQVASQNPHAWQRESYSCDEITIPGEQNRMVGFPYTMRMNANFFVDQAAALVMTDEETAEKMGIDSSRCVYPMGGADLNNIWNLSRRPDILDSPALREAGRLALAQAGVGIEEIDVFDLYSCFPSAVEIACRELGFSPDDERDLSVTGGLPYFGGPGNNYSLHAIAGVVERIRSNPGEIALVTALGWYNTKWSVGVYGNHPGVHPWQTPDLSDIQAGIDARQLPEPVVEAEGRLTIETYVIGHGRSGEADHGVVLGRLEDGNRAFALIDTAQDDLGRMEQFDLIGLSGNVRHDKSSGYNFIKIDGL